MYWLVNTHLDLVNGSYEKPLIPSPPAAKTGETMKTVEFLLQKMNNSEELEEHSTSTTTTKKKKAEHAAGAGSK